MSSSLFIFIDEGIKFKKNETIKAISKIAGIYNFYIEREENIDDYILSCQYDYQEYSVDINFWSDLETISVKRVSKASLNFAFQLQQLITQPIRIINSGYCFDISLQEIKSFEELEQKVMEAYNQC